MGTALDLRLMDQLLRHGGPVIHHQDAERAGVSAGSLRRLERSGRLVRVGKGAFVPRSAWDATDQWGQFRLRAIGFERCTTVDGWLTGLAAAVLHGFPVIGKPPELPTILRPGNPHVGSARTPWGRTRTGWVPTGERDRRGGARCTGAALTAVDVARHEGPVAGLLVADAAMARGTDRERMARIVDGMPTYPGIRTAAWVVEHADPRAESPLETLGRHAFLSAGRPAPLSNVWIPAGGRWFRVDHLLPDDGVVVEADGALKYNNRSDAAAVVREQVERERALRSLGLGFVRYDWTLVRSRPSEVVHRADQAARLRSHRQPFTNWSWHGPAHMKLAEM